MGKIGENPKRYEVEPYPEREPLVEPSPETTPISVPVPEREPQHV